MGCVGIEFIGNELDALFTALCWMFLECRMIHEVGGLWLTSLTLTSCVESTRM